MYGRAALLARTRAASQLSTGQGVNPSRWFPSATGQTPMPATDFAVMAARGMPPVGRGYDADCEPMPNRRYALVRNRQMKAQDEWNAIRRGSRSAAEAYFASKKDLEGEVIHRDGTSAAAAKEEAWAREDAVAVHPVLVAGASPTAIQANGVDGPTGEPPSFIIHQRRTMWGSSRRILKELWFVSIDHPQSILFITNDQNEYRGGGYGVVDRTPFQSIGRQPRFEKLDEAIAYAMRNGMKYRVIADLKPNVVERPRQYAQNFDFSPEDRRDKFSYSDDI